MKITLITAFLPCALASGAIRGVLDKATKDARSLVHTTLRKGMGRPTSAPTMAMVRLCLSFEIATSRIEFAFLTSLYSYHW